MSPLPKGKYPSLLVRFCRISPGFEAGQILLGELTEIWVNFCGVHTATKLNSTIQIHLSCVIDVL
jgi:hypothetical protein